MNRYALLNDGLEVYGYSEDLVEGVRCIDMTDLSPEPKVGWILEGSKIVPKNKIKIYDYLPDYREEKESPPLKIDFVTGLSTKLHRKSTLVKGECIKEEYFSEHDGTNYSNLVVVEETSYLRDPLGFPISKTVVIRWVNYDESFHPVAKTWSKLYSPLEKVQEGKTRRGNLVSNLQPPVMVFMALALTSAPTPTPEVLIKGREFLSDYSKEFNTFVEDSNKEILSLLSNPLKDRYASPEKYPWLDYLTPYGFTIRQYLLSELSI